ncbi:MAG TPA: class I SAM-dependent methyltransferase [Gammaproteobacteria bacterium]|nr:class I SAM-dependent methyltransferase [Gammaproteobacteria bacterium]
MQAPTERFSDRVADYVRYRPSYPEAVFDLLARRCGLAPGTVVADIGAGTGIFSQLLLQRGARVFAVEPNAGMRAAAERLLAHQPNLTSVAGTAEDSGLPDAAVDLITAAQAFHWFDRSKARAEFMRILKPGGHLALIWNEREVQTTPFLQAYERLLQNYAPEYGVVDHRHISVTDVAAFFQPGRVEFAAFPYSQQFDYPGLKGRLLSSSYAPAAGHPNHEPMLAELRAIFDRYQASGRVVWHYRTRVFYGRLANQ